MTDRSEISQVGKYVSQIKISHIIKSNQSFDDILEIMLELCPRFGPISSFKVLFKTRDPNAKDTIGFVKFYYNCAHSSIIQHYARGLKYKGKSLLFKELGKTDLETNQIDQSLINCIKIRWPLYADDIFTIPEKSKLKLLPEPVQTQPSNNNTLKYSITVESEDMFRCIKCNEDHLIKNYNDHKANCKDEKLPQNKLLEDLNNHFKEQLKLEQETTNATEINTDLLLSLARDSCPICLQSFLGMKSNKVRTLTCNHKFCHDCLKKHIVTRGINCSQIFVEKDGISQVKFEISIETNNRIFSCPYCRRLNLLIQPQQR